MKIYSLCRGITFHPSLFFFSVKRCEKITKGVDRVVAHSTYYITQTAVLTRDIISNALADNIRSVCHVLYYIINTCQYVPIYNLDK